MGPEYSMETLTLLRSCENRNAVPRKVAYPTKDINCNLLLQPCIVSEPTRTTTTVGKKAKHLQPSKRIYTHSGKIAQTQKRSSALNCGMLFTRKTSQRRNPKAGRQYKKSRTCVSTNIQFNNPIAKFSHTLFRTRISATPHFCSNNLGDLGILCTWVPRQVPRLLRSTQTSTRIILASFYVGVLR